METNYNNQIHNIGQYTLTDVIYQYNVKLTGVLVLELNLFSCLPPRLKGEGGEASWFRMRSIGRCICSSSIP